MCISKPASLPLAALCFRAERRSATQQVDFEMIDKAILEIEKRTSNLDEVRKSAETIQSASAKILDRIRKDREALEKQVEILREKVKDLRETRLRLVSDARELPSEVNTPFRSPATRSLHTPLPQRPNQSS